MTLLLSGISATLYRLGGMKGFNTKARDLGCPTIAFIWMLLYGGSFPWWIHFIAFGLLFASLTTYYDSIFGYDNFWMHGFVIGLAYFPYAIISGLWWLLIARALILAVFMGGLNYVVNKLHVPFSDWIEELGRGFAIVYTLTLFI